MKANVEQKPEGSQELVCRNLRATDRLAGMAVALAFSVLVPCPWAQAQQEGCAMTVELQLDSARACCAADQEKPSLVADGQSQFTAYVLITGSTAQSNCCTDLQEATAHFVGDSLGCSLAVDVSGQQIHSEGVTVKVTVTAGTTNGTVSVAVTVAAWARNTGWTFHQVSFSLDLCGAPDGPGQDCPSCTGWDGGPGTGPLGSVGVENATGPLIWWGLGPDSPRLAAGYLWLRGESPSPNLATPSALKLPYGHRDTPGGRSHVVVIAPSGTIEQIKVPQGLITVVVQNDHKYSLNAYYDRDVSFNGQRYETNQGGPFVS